MRAHRAVRLHKVRLIVVILLLILSTSSGLAEERKGQLGITGVIASGFPNSDLAELTNTALGVGLETEYFVSNRVSLGFLVNYLPFQGPSTVSDYTLSEEWKTFCYGLMGKYYFSPEKELVPYLKMGGLLTNYDVQIIRKGIPGDSNFTHIDTSFTGKSKLTVQGGMGIKWDFSSKVGFSGELLFSKFFGVVHDLQGNRRNINAQYVSFNLSASMFFGKTKGQSVPQ